MAFQALIADLYKGVSVSWRRLCVVGFKRGALVYAILIKIVGLAFRDIFNMEHKFPDIKSLCVKDIDGLEVNELHDMLDNVDSCDFRSFFIF